MDDFKEIKKNISKSIAVKKKLLNKSSLCKISQIANAIIKGLKAGKKILACGNGGSAADAQHLAAELVNRYLLEREPLPAIALTTDSSVLTSIANDFSYQDVFKRQIEAIGQANDILIALSTSGRSKSILNAVKAGKNKGLLTIGLTGQRNNPLAKMADFSIQVPTNEVARVQEAHILILHILCDLVDRNFTGEKSDFKK